MIKPFFKKGQTEAGIDEAGRGCYAGPVFAAAVILPPDFRHPLLNDSKQLTAKKRQLLRPLIEKECICFSVCKTDHEEIDRINILQATFKAMHGCVEQLKVRPDLLLIDGNRFRPYLFMAHRCIVGGDGLYASIAAASILAKTYRDEYMETLHFEYPHYGWDRNKGYGTQEHRDAIEQHGLSPYHRKSFDIAPELS